MLWYDTKIYLIFVSSSGKNKQTNKTLGISWVMSVFCYSWWAPFITPEFTLIRWLGWGGIASWRLTGQQQKDQVVRGWELSIPPANLWDQDGRLAIELYKTLWNNDVWITSELVKTSVCWEGSMAALRGRGNSMPCLPPYLALGTSSIWLFLNCILYNKPVNINKVVPCILWIILKPEAKWVRGSCCLRR